MFGYSVKFSFFQNIKFLAKFRTWQSCNIQSPERTLLVEDGLQIITRRHRYMQYYKFQHIFDEYSRKKKPTKANEHDIEKIRDKFTEIVDMVGIDIDLLRKHKDAETGEMVSFDISNRQFCFPEEICDFCVEILKRYTSSDFKRLRKGQYKEVAISELKFLIEGFTQYLTYLGYDFSTILEEKFKMEKRLNYNISVQLYQLNQECRGLLDDAENYIDSPMEGVYEDKVYFTWYIVEKIKKLREYIASVYISYIDTRCEELDHFAEKEAFNISTAETLTDIQQSVLLADALEHDKNYQALLKKQMEIICTPDFIKKLKTSYNKISSHLNDIREQHKQELFGDRNMERGWTYNFTLKHPLCVLSNAIQWTEETAQLQAESREMDAVITEEQQKKKSAELTELYLQYFELPDIRDAEQKIKKKGIIKFPCCDKEETVVYEGAAGCVINKCPRCSKQVLFNFDEMTADIYETPKGHMKI